MRRDFWRSFEDQKFAVLRDSFGWWMRPLEMVFREWRWRVGDNLRKLKCFSWIDASVTGACDIISHQISDSDAFLLSSFLIYTFIIQHLTRWHRTSIPINVNLGFARPSTDLIFTCRKTSTFAESLSRSWLIKLAALLDCREEAFLLA